MNILTLLLTDKRLRITDNQTNKLEILSPMKTVFQAADVDHFNRGHFNIHTFSLSKLKDNIKLKK